MVRRIKAGQLIPPYFGAAGHTILGSTEPGCGPLLPCNEHIFGNGHRAPCGRLVFALGQRLRGEIDQEAAFRKVSLGRLRGLLAPFSALAASKERLGLHRFLAVLLLHAADSGALSAAILRSLGTMVSIKGLDSAYQATLCSI